MEVQPLLLCILSGKQSVVSAFPFAVALLEQGTELVKAQGRAAHEGHAGGKGGFTAQDAAGFAASFLYQQGACAVIPWLK